MRKKVLFKVISIMISSLLTFSCLLTGFASTGGHFLHKVSSADSLWKLSQEYKVGIQDIMNANNLKNSVIIDGQILKIPAKNYDNTILYTINRGDTLSKIAAYHKITVQDIAALNNISANAIIYAGQKLYIPRKSTLTGSDGSGTDNIIHTVKSGESTWTISRQYNVSEDSIRNANGLKASDYIFPGQKLVIPGSSKAPGNNSSGGNSGNQGGSTKPYVTYINHTVKSGDNPWNLSIKYGIPMNEILEANNMNESTPLSIGQQIKIPVHHVPVTSTPGPQYGEYLDWWTQAQYVVPIGARMKVTDFKTGRSYNAVRSYGAFHADCEPLTSRDAQIMYEIWGNTWSWVPRASIVEYNGRKIAASVTNMPHDIEEITDNNFNGHFDIHFLNSTTHKDNTVSQAHQQQIKIAAGL